MKNNPATFAQSLGLCSLVHDKRLSREQLQLIFDSGLFSDLLEAVKRNTLPEITSEKFKNLRRDFKELIGIFDIIIAKKIIQRIKIIYNVDIRKYYNEFIYFDEHITEKNFPNQYRLGEQFCDATLVKFNKPTKADQVLVELKNLNLRPGTAKALLFLARHINAFPTSEVISHIIALRDSWVDEKGCKKIVCYNVNSKAMNLSSWNFTNDEHTWYITF